MTASDVRPLGISRVAESMAARTVSSERPICAMRRGSSRTRTAARSAPLITACDTPGIWDIFCATTLSAKSYTSPGASTSEVKASTIMATPPGSAL